MFNDLDPNKRYVVEVELDASNAGLLLTQSKKFTQTFNNKTVEVNLYVNNSNPESNVIIDPFIQCIRGDEGIIAEFSKYYPVITGAKTVVVDLVRWGHKSSNKYVLWEVI